jgi:hypothetical protein
MEKTIGIVMAVYALILWVMIFFVWHKGYKEWKTNRENRIREHRARLVNKTEAVNADGSPSYLLTFDMEGRQTSFPVDYTTYSSARIGQEGMVSLRGGRHFEAFEAKSEAERADEIYRRMVKD